jgi:DNA-directed RNA polymerase beta subunit
MDGSAVPLKNRRYIKRKWRNSMIYQWRIPNIYSVSAQEAGAEINGCKNNDGFITPEAVVEKAKDASSVIHGCFEWDDRDAAGRYRLHQAGELIRNIVTVNVSDGSLREAPVRAFVNIKDKTERGYKTIEAVISDPYDYQYMLGCARSDLEAFSRKYAKLAELRGVLSAIQEVLNETD